MSEFRAYSVPAATGTPVHKGLWLSLLIVLASPLTRAAEFIDPMKPAGFDSGMSYQGEGGVAVRVEGTLPATAGVYKLNGLFIRPDGNSAIINDQWVRSGDTIAPDHVVRVNNDSVEIMHPRGVTKLELISISVKQPSAESSGGRR